jgi:hypothetical protein
VPSPRITCPDCDFSFIVGDIAVAHCPNCVQEFRYIGVRDSMRFYDCDDEEQFAELESAVETEDLVGRTLIQSFAPDTPEEAVNRGFRPLA